MKLNLLNISTFVIIILHLVGVVGMLFYDTNQFASLSDINLWISIFLVLINFSSKKVKSIQVVILIALVGFLAEVIGVNTGLIFGDYFYQNNLGFKLWNVPLIIGGLWATLSVGIVSLLRDKLRNPVVLTVISALILVLFDWVMEPVAIRLHFWKWNSPHIPVLNYVTWFLVGILTTYLAVKFTSKNIFSIRLLLIQLVFFIVLNILL